MRKTQVYGVLCGASLVIGLGLMVWGFTEKSSKLASVLTACAGVAGIGLVMFAAPILGAMSQGNAPFTFFSRRGRRAKCPHCLANFGTNKLHDPDINPTLECPKCKRSFRW